MLEELVLVLSAVISRPTELYPQGPEGLVGPIYSLWLYIGPTSPLGPAVVYWSPLILAIKDTRLKVQREGPVVGPTISQRVFTRRHGSANLSLLTLGAPERLNVKRQQKQIKLTLATLSKYFSDTYEALSKLLS